MQSLKETVDKYLIDNYGDILFKTKEHGFRWMDIATSMSPIPNSEYLRNRWRKIKDKYQEELSTITSKEIQKYKFQTGKEDKSKGTKEFTFTADNIPSEEEIISHFNIDTTKYKISQIWHKTTPSGKYSISVNLLALKGNQLVELDNDFINHLSKIKPLSNELNTISHKSTSQKQKACLVIPKQDSHWNKSDIEGRNDINERFKTFTKTLLHQLENVSKTHNLEEILYIIGSDEFNSEYMGTTTAGTPQQNILSHKESFEKISEFNIEIIKLLRFYSPKVKVMLLNGNHDHNVSWHLAHLLKHVFSKNTSIEINDSLENTKVYSYSENLILLNHGDRIKPKDLAAKFPIIAKDKWSQHSNYFVLTGDKHHEISHDFNGVMWYQVPQLSTAKSNWDDKMGFITSKAELLTFLFEEDGLSNILRKQIK